MSQDTGTNKYPFESSTSVIRWFADIPEQVNSNLIVAACATALVSPSKWIPVEGYPAFRVRNKNGWWVEVDWSKRK